MGAMGVVKLKNKDKMDLNIRNKFEQSLIDEGYKIFTINYKNALRGFQKKVEDEKGVRYFINVYHYNHSEQLGLTGGDTYTSDVNFIFKDATSVISYFGDKDDVNVIEDYFYKCWQSLEPDYYELYN